MEKTQQNKTEESGKDYESLWTPEEITKALLYTFDILSQSHIPFVLVGSVAHQAYYNLPFSAVKITVVVDKNYNTEENTRLLKILVPNIGRTTDGYKLVYNTTPVWIKFLSRHYEVLKNPDIVSIGGEAFYIPNPFKKYWEMEEHFDL